VSRYFLAGAAGFIASRVAALLMAEGHSIVGVDNINDAYDVRVKQHRLDSLKANDLFSFSKIDIADKNTL
jgi:UDP-glucuronate 4-epimerase